MNFYSYDLKIAGLFWRYYLPYPVEASERMIPFLVNTENNDITIRFQKKCCSFDSEMLIREKNPRVWRGEEYYRVERGLASSSNYYSSLIFGDGLCTEAEGYLYPGAENRVSSLERVLDISELETFLAWHETVSLHSSLIKNNNKGILFTAPSGTGKSTQADLWEHFRGAEQLNGDRSLIRNINGRWNAFGSPFAGTSGIYRNDSAEVHAIAIIRQSANNRIEEITEAEAFRLLYSETVIPKWHKEAHLRVVDLLTKLAKEVPVFIFHCTPEEDAVNVLDSYLKGVHR